MNVLIASDHAGFEVKEEIKKFLYRRGIKFKDFGTKSNKSCDYPDFALKVSKKVLKGKETLGVLVCGTGIGMCMAANKVKGVRAALCTNEFMAKAAREHNNANVLCLGARVIDRERALRIVNIFLNTPFSKEKRHIKRVNKIKKIEK